MGSDPPVTAISGGLRVEPSLPESQSAAPDHCAIRWDCQRWHYKDGRTFCILIPTHFGGQRPKEGFLQAECGHMTPICHLSSIIHHLSAPGSYRQDQKTGRSIQLFCSPACLLCAWLGTCSGPPASSPEWGAGISAGLPNEWAFPPRLPLSYNSSYLRQNQLLMRPLPSESPSGPGCLPAFTKSRGAGTI